MKKTAKMKEVKVGVVYQSHGYITVKVPATLKTHKEMLQYIKDKEEEGHSLPLPMNNEYIDNSFEIDSVDGLCVQEIG